MNSLRTWRAAGIALALLTSLLVPVSTVSANHCEQVEYGDYDGEENLERCERTVQNVRDDGEAQVTVVCELAAYGDHDDEESIYHCLRSAGNLAGGVIAFVEHLLEPVKRVDAGCENGVYTIHTPTREIQLAFVDCVGPDSFGAGCEEGVYTVETPDEDYRYDLGSYCIGSEEFFEDLEECIDSGPCGEPPNVPDPSRFTPGCIPITERSQLCL